MTGSVAKLVDSVTQRKSNLPARLDSRAEEISTNLAGLKRTLDRALHELEGRAGIRDLRIGDGLDPERIRSLVRDEDFAKLSSREARWVALSFLDFPRDRLAQLLDARPALWRTFARRILLQWEASLDRADWDDYSSLLAQIPTSLSPVEAPMTLSLLASREGARTAAIRVEGKALGEVHQRIVEDWRLHPSWSLTVHILVEWMRLFAGRPQGLLESARQLSDPMGPGLRALVLPPPSNPSAARGAAANLTTKRSFPLGSPVAQVRAVAALLVARFGGSESLDEPTFGTLESLLLRSSFGDPRAVTVSVGWEQVRRLADRPYDAFLQTLVREDLALFFRHLMRADDRERFWLRYLGSIRRTLCVLDPDGYNMLDRKLTGAPESIRAALGRVVRTRRSDMDKTCAFCLFFEDYVMVEFSVVGNAGYLYDRGTFEQVFFPRIRQELLDSPAALKDKRKKRHHLRHQKGWQETMSEELFRLRIEADRPSGRRR